MDEDIKFSENPPETAPNSTQPQAKLFDPDSENGAESSNSLGAKIRDAANSAFAKVGGAVEAIKRGRGRPKNCVACGLPETKCQCEKVASLAGEAPGAANGQVDFEAEIVEMLTDSVIKGATDVCNSKILEFGVLLKEETYCAGLVTRLTPDADKLEKIGKLTHIVLKKHEVSTKYLAESVLAASVLSIAVSYAMALRTLSAAAHVRDFGKITPLRPVPKSA